MLTRVPALILVLAPLLEAADDEVDWPSVSSYLAGDIATEEIIAPIDLEVVDPKATATARHAVIAQLQPVYRSLDADEDPTVAAVVNSFESTRDRFVAEVSQRFSGHPIGHREANSSRFREFRTRFQQENKGFPVGNLLGLTWALGRDDSGILSPILDTIGDVYADRVVLDESERDLPTEILLIEDDSEIRSGRTALFEAGKLVRQSEIVGLNDMRREVHERLEVDYRPVSAFITGLLQSNARFDGSLNDVYRQEKVESVFVFNQFRAGDLLVRKGRIITEDTMRIFRNLDSQARLQNTVPPSGIVASHPGLGIYQPNLDADSGLHGLALGFLTCAVLLLLVMLTWFFHRQTSSGLVPIQGNAATGAIIPDGLAAQLARELRDRVVQSFYTQRDDLLRAERSATMSVRELEDRPAKLQPKILAKIQEYETRIAELEDQLAQKESENQDLIRARIDEVRQKLNAELARHDIILN
jgi:hypothetical protein